MKAIMSKTAEAATLTHTSTFSRASSYTAKRINSPQIGLQSPVPFWSRKNSSEQTMGSLGEVWSVGLDVVERGRSGVVDDVFVLFPGEATGK